MSETSLILTCWVVNLKFKLRPQSWTEQSKCRHTSLNYKLCCQVPCAPSSQICVQRKCKWYFIVKPKEGNTGEHAEEDRLGVSPEAAPDLLANKNMLCVVQITWHGGVKQRAATASHTSLGETHISQTGAHHCKEHLVSEQCDRITRNSISRNHDLASGRCPL